MRKINAVGLLFVFMAAPLWADDIAARQHVAIDTDMGVDDAVTLALALQNPHMHIFSIIACEGVAEGDVATLYADSMLDRFNRNDVTLYAPARSGAGDAPPFRTFAQSAIGRVLSARDTRCHKRFSEKAYITSQGKSTVLVLGPLTNLAAAISASPQLKQHIEKVVIAGPPHIERNWNLSYDPESYRVVRESGLSLVFVDDNDQAEKPTLWQNDTCVLGRAHVIGDVFFRTLLSDSDVRSHYFSRLKRFGDELAILCVAEPQLFTSIEADRTPILVPRDRTTLHSHFIEMLTQGRQAKHRVVFEEGPLPDSILRDDVRRMKASTLARHGEVEWFAQLMMNELHEHLGAYSVVGVKMGLRAAELLNAPTHGMKVVSHAAPYPPISCLNDGVIVVTGSTPGRRLFEHQPGDADSTSVTFTHHGRSVTLALKAAYREKIREAIQELLSRHTLEDEAYWAGVRELGLQIWSDWYRDEIFDEKFTRQP